MDGTPHVVKGLYFISDNGYPRWSGLMRPMKQTLDGSELYYSEWIESARKDIEFVFGILKSRFRFLRNAISHHDQATIGNAFKTAAILHNMLLKYDNLQLEFGWDLEETFMRLYPNNYEDKDRDVHYRGAEVVDDSLLNGLALMRNGVSEKMKLVTFFNLYDNRIRKQLLDSILLKSPRVIETSNTSFENFSN